MIEQTHSLALDELTLSNTGSQAERRKHFNKDAIDFGDPCYWVSVNAQRRLGVCSECAIRMCNALLFPEPSDADLNAEIMAAARS